MFVVPCHLIQHISSGLSGPWCDSSFCKNVGTDAASFAYNFLYDFLKISSIKAPYSALIFPGLGVGGFNECSQSSGISFHLRG